MSCTVVRDATMCRSRPVSLIFSHSHSISQHSHTSSPSAPLVNSLPLLPSIFLSSPPLLSCVHSQRIWRTRPSSARRYGMQKHSLQRSSSVRYKHTRPLCAVNWHREYCVDCIMPQHTCNKLYHNIDIHIEIYCTARTTALPCITPQQMKSRQHSIMSHYTTPNIVRPLHPHCHAPHNSSFEIPYRPTNSTGTLTSALITSLHNASIVPNNFTQYTSGAIYLKDFMASGINHFRIEFVDEKPEDVVKVISMYQDVCKNIVEIQKESRISQYSHSGDSETRNYTNNNNFNNNAKTIGDRNLESSLNNLWKFLEIVPNGYGLPQGVSLGSLKPTLERNWDSLKPTAKRWINIL